MKTAATEQTPREFTPMNSQCRRNNPRRRQRRREARTVSEQNRANSPRIVVRVLRTSVNFTIDLVKLRRPGFAIVFTPDQPSCGMGRPHRDHARRDGWFLDGSAL